LEKKATAGDEGDDLNYSPVKQKFHVRNGATKKTDDRLLKACTNYN
jgi:hypothetical protein